MTARAFKRLLLAASLCVLVAGFATKLSAAAFTRATAVPGNTVSVDQLANHFSATPGSNNQPGTSTPIVSGNVDTLAIAVGTVPSARTFTQLFNVTNTSGYSQTGTISVSGVPEVGSAVFTSTGTNSVTLANGASDWVKLTTSSTSSGHGLGTLRLALSGSTWLYRDYSLTIDEAPEAPTALTATAHAAGQVALSWTAPSTANVTGYNVYRSSGGAYSKVNSSVVAGASYTDTATTDGTAYTYEVKAVAGGSPTLESLASSTASATADATAPAAPTVTAYVEGATKATADTVTIAAEAGSVVTVVQSAPSALTVSGTATGGSVTLALDAAQKGQTVTLSITATDAAGNVSATTHYSTTDGK